MKNEQGEIVRVESSGDADPGNVDLEPWAYFLERHDAIFIVDELSLNLDYIWCACIIDSWNVLHLFEDEISEDEYSNQ